MTGEMLHAVEIHAEPHAIFEAVATQRGQTAFWTADAHVQPSVGSIADFGFPGAPVRLNMRVEQLEPDRLVAWQCQGDFPYWTGTRVRWEIRPAQNPDESTMFFSHTGWPADYPPMEYAHVNFTWGQIVARLKAYVESGQPQPYFSAAAATHS
jgi:uncharacterized protein YndB with AHSA1/START domain